jgi:hypothetical protein
MEHTPERAPGPLVVSVRTCLSVRLALLGGGSFLDLRDVPRERASHLVVVFREHPLGLVQYSVVRESSNPAALG